MSFRLNSPTCKDSAIAMVRSQGQRVGRLWACRDRFLENADVYTLDGRAWILTAKVPGVLYCDWFDFCNAIRANDRFNLAPAGLVHVEASSR